MSAPGQRQQLQAEDFGDNNTLRRALNDVLLDVQQRLGKVEGLNQLYVPPAFLIEIGASAAYGVRPFPIRVALPADVTPVGVLLCGIENQTNTGAPATVAHDVKWLMKPGSGGILVRHIPGLAVSTKYLVRLVVIRG